MKKWGIFKKYPNPSIQYPMNGFFSGKSSLSQRIPKRFGIWMLEFGILVCLLVPQTVDAQCAVEKRHITSLQGYARVEWIHKKRVFRYDEAIVIQSPEKASFETIDDFGNTLFRMDFFSNALALSQAGLGRGSISEKKFRKILSLPLSQSEFIHYLLYQVPNSVEGLEPICNASGDLVSVEKKSKKKKKRYKISFLNLKRTGRVTYPRVIEIVSKKTTLRILWQSVKVK